MTLKLKIKTIIIKELGLEDLSPNDIGDDAILFGGDLGLDSIDAVEVVYQIKKHFGIEIRDMKEGRKVLQSVNTLAAFIENKKAA